MTLKEAKKKIEKAMDQNGPFTHNMVGLVLSQVDRELGTKQANKLIDEYNLYVFYGIKKAEDDG